MGVGFVAGEDLMRGRKERGISVEAREGLVSSEMMLSKVGTDGEEKRGTTPDGKR